ncbi:DNA helicase RecQ [Aliiglaciecola lipolytica]|uniref:DNA helicase RecQ n=1 Tax=Aliiglaciecola lipolytica E3 TaxID=1127673 RepID=K6YBE4_9ALTE|nr:DNA helicase RecQ [Aliiglaciecola lipolytica]GAC15507.1 ATP-dependent DNA helicase RecQ [Aliiglaciecola lipolytica E3]
MSSPTLEKPLPIENSTKPAEVLKEVFGYSHFRDGQQQVIEQVLSQRDALVLMPTGGGKSLCYQIPALILPGITIVVSPLISLMKDQVDALTASGVAATFINSSIPREQLLNIYRQLQDGKFKLLYVAPERLMQLEFIDRLHTLNLSLIAVDEAHCVSHWGHDFRQDYRLLGQLKTHFPNIPVMGLTATADIATRADITQQLNLQTPYVFRSSFDRPNIRYNLLSKYKAVDQLIHYVKGQEGSGIVYCNSRAKVDELSFKLAKQGINSAGYHAGLEPEIREKIQRDFIQDNVDVIVATVAFGMGINKSNVRYVVHFDLPRSIESYYQETGRAGRDGMPAEALLLYDEKDAARIRQWIAMGENTERHDVELQKFAAMEAFADAQTCRRQVLLNYFSEYSGAHCGNCDICVNPPKRFDGTIQAQKVLSCIYRLEQNAATQYVIDVLRGKSHKRIVEQQHDKLPTHGAGKDQSEAHWHNVISQLIHQGLIRIDITQNATLKLTEAARPVLKSEVQVTLAVPRLALETSKRGKNDKRHYDRVLFAKLKHLRKSISEQDDVPPFVVFSDASLADMAEYLPNNSSQFLQISGVGKTKLERYGERFLALISQHLETL